MKTLLLICLVIFCNTILSFSQTFNPAKLDSLFVILNAKNKYMGSIALTQNGTTLYTNTIGYADVATKKLSNATTKYRIGSITKMFTAVLIFKAIEEEKITLSTTIQKYFPTIKNANKITISNLLNHRSGIHNFTDDEAYLTYNTKAKSKTQTLKIIADGGSDFEVNSTAAYSNSNYLLLSYLLEILYKTTYAQQVNQKIVKPLALTHTNVGGKINISNNECNSYSFETNTWKKETETNMNIPLGAGAIISTPNDLAKFLTCLFTHNLVAASSLQSMKTITEGYGLGMFKVPFYKEFGYGHTGGIDGFSSAAYYFEADKLAVAITSNGQNYSNNDILIAALSSYYNKPYAVPTFENIIKSTAALDVYLGTYSSPTFPLKIKITKDKLDLIAQDTGQGAFTLTCTAIDNFEYQAAGIKITFVTTTNQLILNQGGGSYTLTKE